MRLTTAAALAGAADTCVFLAQRGEMFRNARGRAFGSAAFGGLWLALAASSAAERGRPSPTTTALAATVAAGTAGMLAVHVRRGIMSPRVFLGAGLAGVALLGALRRR